MKKVFRKAVYLVAWDHSLDQAPKSAPIKIEIFGILWKEDKLCYYILPWICNGTLEDENNECYAILKSTVISKQELVIKGKK